VKKRVTNRIITDCEAGQYNVRKKGKEKKRPHDSEMGKSTFGRMVQASRYRKGTKKRKGGREKNKKMSGRGGKKIVRTGEQEKTVGHPEAQKTPRKSRRGGTIRQNW